MDTPFEESICFKIRRNKMSKYKEMIMVQKEITALEKAEKAGFTIWQGKNIAEELKSLEEKLAPLIEAFYASSAE
jgi:hypothetical protein